MSEVNIEGVVDEIVKMVIASLKKDLAESVARIEELEKENAQLKEDNLRVWMPMVMAPMNFLKKVERLEKALREIADNGEHGDYDECIGPAIARAALEEKP